MIEYAIFLSGLSFGVCLAIIQEFVSREPRPKRTTKDVALAMLTVLVFGIFFGVLVLILTEIGVIPQAVSKVGAYVG